MTPAWIYQYISLNQQEEKILQLLRKCLKAGVYPVLDVEDSLQIPLEAERTQMLKGLARQRLSQILMAARNLKVEIAPCLRINGTESDEFQKDILMLKELGELITWEALFLPKVHTGKVLETYLEALEGIPHRELVVMAESSSFFGHFNEINTLCKQEGIQKIHFGHWDYFLDLRHFPIPLPDDRVLWDRVESLIRMIEPEGFNYIHTPCCFLMDHDMLRTIAGRLRSLTANPYGMSTLSFSQALSLTRFLEDGLILNTVQYDLSEGDKMQAAQDLVAFFHRPVPPEFSFNIDTKDYRFYAPHEFLNAMMFLERNKR